MKEFLKKLWRFTWKAAMWFVIVSVFSVILFRWVPIPVTPLMLTRCVEQKIDGKDMKLKKDWVPLEEISPDLQLAVVCSEDQNFLKHHGFDFDAIQKAMEYNDTHERTRGASTISQQVAKNVFLWQGNGITRRIRKGFEAYFTVLIELFWSKQRIMEVYLNVIEMGDGVYGAQAASKEFFKKDAKYLTREEAARIAAVLPNPIIFKAARPSAHVLSRSSWIQNQMSLWGGVLRYEVPEEKTRSSSGKKRKKQ
ncbi:MAG: monofunctional biosynthetic peptidoglycan transglycosylase [Bacteroidia bacterium]